MIANKNALIEFSFLSCSGEKVKISWKTQVNSGNLVSQKYGHPDLFDRKNANSVLCSVVEKQQRSCQIDDSIVYPTINPSNSCPVGVILLTNTNIKTWCCFTYRQLIVTLKDILTS